jgi:hypothetical protein
MNKTVIIEWEFFVLNTSWNFYEGQSYHHFPPSSFIVWERFWFWYLIDVLKKEIYG